MSRTVNGSEFATWLKELYVGSNYMQAGEEWRRLGFTNAPDTDLLSVESNRRGFRYFDVFCLLNSYLTWFLTSFNRQVSRSFFDGITPHWSGMDIDLVVLFDLPDQQLRISIESGVAGITNPVAHVIMRFELEVQGWVEVYSLVHTFDCDEGGLKTHLKEVRGGLADCFLTCIHTTRPTNRNCLLFLAWLNGWHNPSEYLTNISVAHDYAMDQGNGELVRFWRLLLDLRNRNHKAEFYYRHLQSNPSNLGVKVPRDVWLSDGLDWILCEGVHWIHNRRVIAFSSAGGYAKLITRPSTGAGPGQSVVTQPNAEFDLGCLFEFDKYDADFIVFCHSLHHVIYPWLAAHDMTVHMSEEELVELAYDRARNLQE